MTIYSTNTIQYSTIYSNKTVVQILFLFTSSIPCRELQLLPLLQLIGVHTNNTLRQDIWVAAASW